MHIAMCLFNYFPFGGLQRDFVRIAKAALDRQHSVTVITMEWLGANELNLPVILFSKTGWQNHQQRKHFSQQLQRHLQNHHYDVVLGFNKMPGLDFYYAADTCYQAKALKQHGWWYRWTPRFRSNIALEQAVFGREVKTKILAISAQQKIDFQHYYHTQPERFYLLPPGIARDRAAPPNSVQLRVQKRQELGLTNQQYLLLMVGSGFKTKGLDRIIRGLAALPAELKKDVFLAVVGEDKSLTYESMAKKLSVEKQISFLGGRNDMGELLLAGDLLLHPAYNENTGTVLLEALTAGLPVLTTDVCGYAHYIVDAKAGIVLKSPFNQNEFNKTITTMLLSPDYMQWKINALEFASHADIYSLPERAMTLIEQLGEQ